MVDFIWKDEKLSLTMKIELKLQKLTKMFELKSGKEVEATGEKISHSTYLFLLEDIQNMKLFFILIQSGCLVKKQ